MSQGNQNLLQYLQGCLGPDVQNCQKYILDAMKTPGFSTQMMSIANDNSQQIPVRMMALTNLQNTIRQQWNPKQGEYCLCDNDRQVIKASFLDAISGVANERKLMNIYKSISYDLVALEYPQKWPNLIQDINNRLCTSQNQNEIFSCLVVLQQAYKVNEYFIDEDRNVLNDIIMNSSQGLQQIGSLLSQSYNQDTAEMMKLILKCYDSAIYIDMCPLLADQQQVNSWMCLLKIILDHQMPQELIQQSQDTDQQDKQKANILWKNKKWVGRILTKFAQKYANPVCVMNKQHLQNIPEIFQNNFAVPFLESFVAMLFKISNEYVSPQAIHFALKYIYYVLKYQKAFMVIHPHLEKILFDICLPLCAHTLADDELWKTNADEYLRKEEDYGTTTHQNKNCAMELIEKICLQKDQNGQKFLEKLLPFICQTLEQNADPRTNVGISIVFREGLFWILGRLKNQIERSENLENLTEQMIIKYILPEFNAQAGLLRARACWVLGRYSQIQFQEHQNLKMAIEGICQCLHDKELPVRIRAAIGLDGLVQQPNAKEVLQTHLDKIFQVYIELMTKSDNEGLAVALEGIVETFKEDLSTHAYGLVQHLAQNFQKFVQKNEEQVDRNQQSKTDYDNFQGAVDEDDDAGYQKAAISCLDSICMILDAKLQTSVYSQMEEILSGVIDYCLLDPHKRYLDEGIGILNQILYNQPSVSCKIWFYYPYFMYAVMGVPQGLNLQNYQYETENQKWLVEKLNPKGFMYNHFANLVAPFKNFIAKGKMEIFNTNDFFGNNLFTLLNSLVTFTTMEYQCEGDDKPAVNVPYRSIAVTLFTSLIENNPGNLNHVLPGILQDALKNFLNDNEEKDKAYRLANCELIAVCLYFNTDFTFQYLQSQNQLENFYNLWIQYLPQFKHDYEKEKMLLGLASVLKLQQNQVPQSLTGIIGVLIGHMVTLTGEILKARLEEDSEFGSDVEDEDIDDEDDTDLTTLKDKDREFMHSTISKLKKVEEKMMKQGQNYNPEDDDDYEDEDYNYEETIGENFRYDSPLDKECAIITFDGILQGLQQNNQFMYNLLADNISQQQQQELQKNIAQAKQEWEEGQKQL